MNEKAKSGRSEPAAASAPPRANGPASEGNVDQIRDILFGGQMRDYDRRFGELEERIRREAEKLRGDLLRRMDALEELVRGNQENVQAQLLRIDKDWRAAAEAAAEQGQSQQRALKAELASLEQKQLADSQSLRERLHKLGNDSSDALRLRAEEVMSELERLHGQLREDKVARQELAGFFSEMALRLTHEFELPAGKSSRG